MAKIAQPIEIPSGATSQGPARTSIWASIHPRLLELIRAHRSTLLFVNSRRLSERLASALNELAGEPLVRSHHGSIARPQRLEIEDALKAGRLKRAGRHLLAGAGHRHGRHRSGDPDRGAAVGGQRHAAHRAREPPGGRGQRAASSSRSSAATWSRARRSPRRCTRAPSSRRAIRATRSTCSRSRSSRWWPSSRGRPTRLFADDPAGGAVCRAEPARVRRRARHAVGPLSVGRIRRAPAARDVGPRRPDALGARRRVARGDRQRGHHPRPRPVRRLPGRRQGRARAASASSTRRWSSSRAWARRSCSERRPGASRRSRTTACWCRPRRASPARCRSGRATRPGGPASWALPSAGWRASCARCRRRPRSIG